VASFNQTVPSQYFWKRLLPCPAGKVAVGGSVVPTGLAQDPDNRFHIMYSGLADYVTWIIAVSNGTDNDVNLTFSVICVTAP